MAKLYIPIFNRNYDGCDGYYTNAALCSNLGDAKKYLYNEYLNILKEFGEDYVWNDGLFSDNDFRLTDDRYNIYGWIEEVEYDGEQIPEYLFVIISIELNKESDEVVKVEVADTFDKGMTILNRITADATHTYGDMWKWHSTDMTIDVSTENENGSFNTWLQKHKTK